MKTHTYPGCVSIYHAYPQKIHPMGARGFIRFLMQIVLPVQLSLIKWRVISYVKKKGIHLVFQIVHNIRSTANKHASLDTWLYLSYNAHNKTSDSIDALRVSTIGLRKGTAVTADRTRSLIGCLISRQDTPTGVSGAFEGKNAGTTVYPQNILSFLNSPGFFLC